MKVLLDHGTLVEPDAAKFILAQKDPLAFVKGFLASRENLPLLLTLADLQAGDTTQETFEPPHPADEKPQPQTQFATLRGAGEDDEPAPKLVVGTRDSEEFHIISDVTGTSTCDGSVENFTEFFRDRFRIIRRVIKGHVEMSGPMKISQSRFMDRESKIIGMVMDVSKTKNGHIGITVEDDTGELFVLIHKDSELIHEAILKDEVIGLIGKLSAGSRAPGHGSEKRSDMFIPTAIHRPKLPVGRTQRRAAKDIDVVFLSDIHAGSAHFLSDSWTRFTEWINSEDAKNVKYVVVAGDLVDGIGIYPNQDEELKILDIFKQYDEVANLLAPIPRHIKIILQPGNHDAVRPAEPQPAIHEKFRGSFGSNVTFVGNPCYFSIAGVEILAYHGRSIDDLVGAIPGVNYQDPVPPMLEMLKRRLLAISYGGKTPLAPEAKDYMVINPVPDILVTGHVHRTAVHRISGMTLLNASAWQSQTPFQKMHNFHPDPGKVIVTNLKTGRCRIKDFMAKPADT